MNDTPKRAGLSLPLITAVLLVPAFGGGLLVGRSLLERKPPAEEGSAESFLDGEVAADLSACRRELATLPKTRPTPSAADASPGDADGGALEPAARVAELKTQIKACRKSEIVTSAEVCSAVKGHVALMMSLRDDGIACIQKIRAAGIIEEDFERCDEFEHIPAELDLEGLTKEERKSVMEAVAFRKTMTEDALAEKLGSVWRTCYATAEKNKKP